MSASRLKEVLNKTDVTALQDVDTMILYVKNAPRASSWAVVQTGVGVAYAPSLTVARERVSQYLRNRGITVSLRKTLRSNFTGQSLTQANLANEYSARQIVLATVPPKLAISNLPYEMDRHIVNKNGKWVTTCGGEAKWSTLTLARRHVVNALKINLPNANILTAPYQPKAPTPAMAATAPTPSVPTQTVGQARVQVQPVSKEEYPFVVQFPNGTSVACRTAADVRALMV